MRLSSTTRTAGVPAAVAGGLERLGVAILPGVIDPEGDGRSDSLGLKAALT